MHQGLYIIIQMKWNAPLSVSEIFVMPGSYPKVSNYSAISPSTTHCRLMKAYRKHSGSTQEALMPNVVYPVGQGDELTCTSIMLMSIFSW